MAPDVELTRRRSRRLLVLAVVSVLLLAALWVVAVHTEWGQRVDGAAVAGRTHRAGVLDATSHLLDTISIASLALGTTAIVLVALVRSRPHLALTAGAIIAGSCITTEVLKRYVLDRPDLVAPPDPLGMTKSFPSGHVTVAASLAFALIVVVGEPARPLAALCALAYATLVGAGVVTAGWHRPSDVLGAYLVVTAWSGASVAVLIRTQGTVVRRPSRLLRRVPSLSPFLAGAGVGLLFGAMLGVAGALVAARQGQLDAVQLDATYAASVATIAGTALILIVMFVADLRGVSLDPTTEERDAVVPTPAPT